MIFLYDALHKRASYMNAFSNVLEKSGLGEIIRLFPECMKSMFVSSSELKPDDVINILNLTNFDPNDESHIRLKKYLVSFCVACSESGLCTINF